MHRGEFHLLEQSDFFLIACNLPFCKARDTPFPAYSSKAGLASRMQNEGDPFYMAKRTSTNKLVRWSGQGLSSPVQIQLSAVNDGMAPGRSYGPLKKEHEDPRSVSS